MTDVQAMSRSLRRHPAGYWTTGVEEKVSYPGEGSEFCLAVEEQSFWFAHRNRAISAAIETFPPAAGPFLDVGAGNGFVAAELQRGGVDVIAIEPSEPGALNAVRRGVDPVICGTLMATGFEQRVVGGIGLFDVLEHIELDLDFLRGARGYLRPGGRLYLTVPAHPMLWSHEDVYAGHFRRYTLDSVETVLIEAGLTIDYSTYYFSLLPLPIWLFRSIPSRFRKARKGAGSEHRPGGARGGKIAERLLAFELARIRARRRIAFGASCLAVARVC